MAKIAEKITIKIKKDVKFQELVEIAGMIGDLRELISDWRRHEADPLIEKIKERLLGLVDSKFN